MEADREGGRLLAFLNAQKTPGDNRPAFEGRLSLPDDANERQVALWAHTTKAGATMFAGRISKSATEQIQDLMRAPREADDPQLEAAESDGKVRVDAHEVLLFSNTRKAPENGKQPDYWGYCNPGDDAPRMRLAVWTQTTAQGKAMLTGSVKVDEPEQEREPLRERRRERSR